MGDFGMIHTRGHTDGKQAHLDALRAKHASLSQQIDDEIRSPSASNVMIRALKAQKLRIKDQIEQAG
jgi:hypothetical protein